MLSHNTALRNLATCLPSQKAETSKGKAVLTPDSQQLTAVAQLQGPSATRSVHPLPAAAAGALPWP